MLAVLWAPIAQAEILSLVVVGASPVPIGSTRGTLAKEKAIQEGLWEGVARVARDLLEAQAAARSLAESLRDAEAHDGDLGGTGMEGGDAEFGAIAELGRISPQDPLADILAAPGVDPYADPSPAREPPLSGLYGSDLGSDLDPDPEALRLAAKRAREAEDEMIRQALGREMVSFTKSFRIVEDQGERPALFTDDPDVATEYVVLLEVQVETDRVRARMEEAGLLDPLAASELKGIQLEVLGLTHYLGYRALLDVLGSDTVSAEAVFPRNFSSGRVVLSVQGEWATEELLDRLKAAAPENLHIEGAEPKIGADSAFEESPALWGRPTIQAPRQAKLVVRASWAPLPDSPEPDPSVADPGEPSP
ncbi:MAG TPA: hypothetical protein EYQ66_04225 [Myxococcales bacterium]|nr:hypothetical protein [Myxococcales bacterium]